MRFDKFTIKSQELIQNAQTLASQHNNQQIEPSIVFFSGNNKKDTTSFELKAIQPPDSTKNFSIYADVTAGFSLPVDTANLNNIWMYDYTTQGTVIYSYLHQGQTDAFYLHNETVYASDQWPETMTWLAVRDAQVVPVPPAVWLFGSGLLGLVGVARRKAHA